MLRHCDQRPSRGRFYQLVAAERGIAGAVPTGTVGDDVLGERIARGTYIYPPGPSLRLTAGTFRHSCPGRGRLGRRSCPTRETHWRDRCVLVRHSCPCWVSQTFRRISPASC
ncbi:hypothetical protein SAVIM338S_04578 [Streptomyces avidinii]